MATEEKSKSVYTLLCIDRWQEKNKQINEWIFSEGSIAEYTHVVFLSWVLYVTKLWGGRFVPSYCSNNQGIVLVITTNLVSESFWV